MKEVSPAFPLLIAGLIDSGLRKRQLSNLKGMWQHLGVLLLIVA